jgi:hypothetical protein
MASDYPNRKNSARGKSTQRRKEAKTQSFLILVLRAFKSGAEATAVSRNAGLARLSSGSQTRSVWTAARSPPLFHNPARVAGG